MKKLLCLMLVLAFASFAAGATWDGSTDANWAVADNWDTGLVPTSADWAYINTTITNPPVVGTGIDAKANGVVIGNALVTQGLLTMNGGTLEVFNATTTALMLAGNFATTKGRLELNSGYINVHGGIVLSRRSDYRNVGVLNVNGGILDFGTAANQSIWMNYVGTNLAGTATINMGMAGVIRGPNLQMDTDLTWSNINFTVGSGTNARIELTYVDGFPDATWDAFKTRITGYASLMTNEKFMINDTLERITIVPEPATVALLGLGGLALIRKRR